VAGIPTTSLNGRGKEAPDRLARLGCDEAYGNARWARGLRKHGLRYSFFLLEFAMKLRSLVPAVLALMLSLPALPSIAAKKIPIALLGDPASPAAAERTIKITPGTKHVNVERGEIVRFDTGGKSFAWDFNTAETVLSFDLNRVAPPGTLDHKVTAYVAPDPEASGD
jgi:hypothetical protein